MKIVDMPAKNTPTKPRDMSPRRNYEPLKRWLRQTLAELSDLKGFVVTPNYLANQSKSNPVQSVMRQNYAKVGVDFGNTRVSDTTISQSFLSQILSQQTKPSPKKWNSLITTIGLISGWNPRYQVTYEEMLQWIGESAAYPWEKRRKDVFFLTPDPEGLVEFTKILQAAMSAANMDYHLLAEFAGLPATRIYEFLHEGDDPILPFELDALTNVKQFNKYLPEAYQGSRLVKLVYPTKAKKGKPDTIDPNTLEGDSDFSMSDYPQLKVFFDQWLDSFTQPRDQVLAELKEQVQEYIPDIEILDKLLSGENITIEELNLIGLVGMGMESTLAAFNDPRANNEYYAIQFFEELLEGFKIHHQHHQELNGVI